MPPPELGREPPPCKRAYGHAILRHPIHPSFPSWESQAWPLRAVWLALWSARAPHCHIPRMQGHVFIGTAHAMLDGATVPAVGPGCAPALVPGCAALHYARALRPGLFFSGCFLEAPAHQCPLTGPEGWPSSQPAPSLCRGSRRQLPDAAGSPFISLCARALHSPSKLFGDFIETKRLARAAEQSTYSAGSAGALWSEGEWGSVGNVARRGDGGRHRRRDEAVPHVMSDMLRRAAVVRGKKLDWRILHSKEITPKAFCVSSLSLSFFFLSFSL